MRRGKPVDARTYIEMRIEQLKQERTKSNDKMTRMWLWKCVDELRYVLQVMDKKDKEDEEPDIEDDVEYQVVYHNFEQSEIPE